MNERGNSLRVARGHKSEHNRGMERKLIQNAAQKRKTLPQQAAKDMAESAITSTRPASDPMHISKDERGQLTISKAGSIRVAQTFLGSNAQAGQDNTALDNARFAQVTCALPQSKGKCEEPLDQLKSSPKHYCEHQTSIIFVLFC